MGLQLCLLFYVGFSFVFMDGFCLIDYVFCFWSVCDVCGVTE